MSLLQLYSTFLLKHPTRLLTFGSCCVLVLFLITLYFRPLQSFDDPFVGFEARGTSISKRINTWKLLTDDKDGVSILPNSPHYDDGYYQPNSIHANDEDPEPPIIESSIAQNSTANGTLDEYEEEYYSSLVNQGRINDSSLIHHYLAPTDAFCGKLYEGYAQAVISSSRHGLFNLNSMLDICRLDARLRFDHFLVDDAQKFSKEKMLDSFLFTSKCEQYHKANSTTCCNSWSLPNYIACLNNKTSCMFIDSHDMKYTEHLLDLCAPHYHTAPYEECFSPRNKSAVGPVAYCGDIPDVCLRCNGWTYNVLHYLTNDGFTWTTARTGHRAKDLTHTNIFLPIAKSSSLMRYYSALSKHILRTPLVQVKTLNLGLKNSLFEQMIYDDMILFVVALVAILFVISIYTWSFVLSLAILLIICLSLCLSYVIYQVIFNITIFPFMNLLAVVISFGICSDNAMLFCKHWSSDQQSDKPPATNNCLQSETDQNFVAQESGSTMSTEQANLDRMLGRAIKSTSAATFATACSFMISAISQVTAVRCFCIFATLSVITNYLLIILLLPPSLILDLKLKLMIQQYLNEKAHAIIKLIDHTEATRKSFLKIGEIFHQDWIFRIIIRFKFYLIIIFITILLLASILVFHGPTLQPPDDDNIQLLSKQHLFEQYDKNVRRHFAFEKVKEGISLGSSSKFPLEPPDTFPIRVVFGVKPNDNGNYLDPHDRGTLVFDQNFDIADKNTQIWLTRFCHKLAHQHFISPRFGQDMSNCFMETFRVWIKERSCLDPIYPQRSRQPCCEASEFPFDRHTFNICMLEFVNIMRQSTGVYANTNAGLRFMKNSTRVAALIIEYPSTFYTNSYAKLESFFHDIDEWIGWHVNNTAPQGLKSGWFVSSNLELLALRTELEASTTTSVWLEVIFATLALMLSTRDMCLTLAGALTISTIIVVTLASLILLEWTLGVAESILISLTIGLSIDFALHYTVAYSDGIRSRLSNGVIQRILNEVGGPVALATITTSLAGFVIVWSDILAYQELGTFLMLIASVSWLTATFFLLPMLATFDFVRNKSVLYARNLIEGAIKVLIDRL